MNKGISIHQKHLHILTLEAYKSIMNFNSEFMWHCFDTNHKPHTLKKGSRLLIPPGKSVNFGANSITFRESLSQNSFKITK